jgi:hypothetical protein
MRMSISTTVGQAGAADLFQLRVEAVEAGLGPELGFVPVAAHRGE